MASNRFWLLKSILIFSVIYFSLIYPYAHFHQSHNLHSALLASGTDAVVAAFDNSSNGKNEHQSHHSLDEHVGAFCKTNPQTYKGNLGYELVGEAPFIAVDPEEHFSSRIAIADDGTQPQLMSCACIVPRSPPMHVSSQVS